MYENTLSLIRYNFPFSQKLCITAKLGSQFLIKKRGEKNLFQRE
uniref:Uncharacterized protein n=1 Tax=Anguilla anguilla TaxID=7936 RepID=A0A0E9SFN8_ANGAN